MQSTKDKNIILIFDTSIDGHHLEYIHHLYTANENIGKDIVFCIPEGFKRVKGNFEWPSKENVSFHFLPDKVCENLKGLGRLQFARRATALLKKSCDEVKPDAVFLISILQLLPFLPLAFIGRKEEISGIIYKIYLYSWKNYSLIEKLFETIRFMSLRLSKNIKTIFVLNDEVSARRLNTVWNCKKFVSLPDPFQSKAQNISFDKPLLNGTKIKVLHFGGLARRKGTLEIMRTIEELCANDKAAPYQFVFAGKVNSDIREEFYNSYNKLKDQCDILVMDKFCSYEELDELCRECDIILAPYQNVHSSSGVIGYAAKFHKPVVVPNDGLLGKLVRKYKLGVAINNIDSSSLYKLLTTYKVIPTDDKLEDEYIKVNSIVNFNKTIYNNL